MTQNVKLPTVAVGDYYLILTTDRFNNVGESNESNNVKVVPIHMGMPDLVTSMFATPLAADPGQTVPITWTIKNRGSGDAGPSWQDRVYLSHDGVTNDTFVAMYARGVTLTAGSSYTVTQNVKMPSVAVGKWFLILTTDYFNTIVESNEDNNIWTAPITIGVPDLTPVSLNVPAGGESGATLSVTWSIKNKGQGDAKPSWQDRLYLSNSPSLDALSTYLTLYNQTLTVTAGSTYTVTQTAVVPPVAPGVYFVILKTDMYNTVAEVSESNNMALGIFTVSGPDLTPTGFTGPSAGVPGQPVTLTWSVKNQGNVAARPSWQDRVYLSTDGVLDAGDTYVMSYTQGTTVSVGSSYTVTQSAVLPLFAAGHYNLIVKTDYFNNVAEVNENNNTRVMSFTVGMADLTPTGFAGPATAAPGQTVPITWSVKNQGTADALASWQDRVYLSTDTTYDGLDKYVSMYVQPSNLTAGSSYTVTQSVVIPNVAPGSYYLLFRTDHFNAVPESDETNNMVVVPVAVLP